MVHTIDLAIGFDIMRYLIPFSANLVSRCPIGQSRKLLSNNWIRKVNDYKLAWLINYRKKKKKEEEEEGNIRLDLLLNPVQLLWHQFQLQ